MVLLRTLNSLRHYTVLRHQKASLFLRNHPYNNSPISLSTFSNVQTPFNSSVISRLSSSIFQRTFSDTAQLVSADVIEEQIETVLSESDVGELTKDMEKERNKNQKRKNKKKKKKKDGIQVSKDNEKNGSSVEELKNEKDPSDSKLKEIENLKKKMLKLEAEVKNLKGNVKGTEEKKKKKHKKKKEISTKAEDLVVESKPKSLYLLFKSKRKSLNSLNLKNTSNTMEREKTNASDTKQSVVYKQNRVSKPGNPFKYQKPIGEISSEMVSLASRWHEEGYLKNANLLQSQELDLTSFSNHYSGDILRLAAEKFGQEHQEIAKWLSGADLKKVALFGCPSTVKNTTFAAKRLRSFFNIQEDTVCRTCKLNESCKFMNKKVWQKGALLNLPDVMRILTLYDLESVPEELEIPDEIKASIKKVLKEVISLSQ